METGGGQNSYALNGRKGVVTGGTGAIGMAIADLLARSGATIEIWDIRAPDRSSGNDIQFRHVDITDDEAVTRAMAEAATHLGGIDLLVTAGGITGPTAPLAEYDPDDWNRVVDVNLNGVFRCMRAALSHMERGTRGDIVNIASIAGKEGNPAMAAYSAAKAGVIALTKASARELAPTGIRVHAIAPALIETPLLAQMAPDVTAGNLAKIPMGRIGLPAEAAELVAYLVSPGCTFSTGAVHDLSGGRATS